METAAAIEIIRMLVSSAYTLAELGKVDAEQLDKLFQEELAKVKERDPNRLKDV